MNKIIKMANRLLVDYVKNGLRKGISIERLRQEISKKGYPTEQIDAAITQARAELAGRMDGRIKLPGKRVELKKYFIVIAAIIIVLLLIYFSFVLVRKISAYRLTQKCVYEDTYYHCLAVSRNILGHCDRIRNNNSEARCHEYYYFLTAIKTGNTDFCEKIKMSERDAALCEAIVNNDATGCDKISDGNIQKHCRAVILKDLELCQEIQGDITYGYSKDFCTDSVNYLKAYKENNTIFCDNIKDENIKAECLAVIKQDQSLCRKTDIPGCEKVIT